MNFFRIANISGTGFWVNEPELRLAVTFGLAHQAAAIENQNIDNLIIDGDVRMIGEQSVRIEQDFYVRVVRKYHDSEITATLHLGLDAAKAVECEKWYDKALGRWYGFSDALGLNYEIYRIDKELPCSSDPVAPPESSSTTQSSCDSATSSEPHSNVESPSSPAESQVDCGESGS